MPTPPRRRPAAGPPSPRRPKVAGLRKPAPRPDSPPDLPAPNPAARDVTNRDVAGRDVAGRDVAGRDVAGRDVAGRDVADTRRQDAPEQDPRTPTVHTPPGVIPPASTSAPKPAGKPTADEPADGSADETVDDEPAEDETAAPEAARADESTDLDEPENASLVASDGLITAAPPANSDEAHENSSTDDGAPRRPSPTGKRRATGRPAPSDLRGAERATKGVTRRKKVDPARSSLNLAVALAVSALLFAALGLWFKGQGDRLAEGFDRSNAAFVEAAATAEVKTKIISALERALSYDYRDLDRTAAAVDEVLAGKAICEYEAMFGQLKELAPAQKLVHTTIVRELGVRHLSEDRAEALVFIDQTSTRVEDEQSTASGAQLTVSAERVGGTWKITAFDTFDQPLPNGRPMPQC
ncbi:hypothetical protein ACTG9Q_04140 [Actinokineospora sp. 24-640]